MNLARYGFKSVEVGGILYVDDTAETRLPLNYAARECMILDAMAGAIDAEQVALIRLALSRILARSERLAVLRMVQDDTWGDVQ